MKKTTFLMTLACSLCAFSLASCSDDDNKTTTPTSTDLLGYWTVDKVYDAVEEEYDTAFTHNIYFENGSYYSQAYIPGERYVYLTGKWSLTDNFLTLTSWNNVDSPTTFDVDLTSPISLVVAHSNDYSYLSKVATPTAIQLDRSLFYGTWLTTEARYDTNNNGLYETVETITGDDAEYITFNSDGTYTDAPIDDDAPFIGAWVIDGTNIILKDADSGESSQPLKVYYVETAANGKLALVNNANTIVICTRVSSN